MDNCGQRHRLAQAGAEPRRHASEGTRRGNSACGRPRARRELTPGTTTEPPAAHQDPGIGPHSAAEPLPALPAENPTGRQPSRCSAALTV